MWEITMGDAVPAFVHANGPAKVVTYNFLLEKGAKVQSQLVTRRPARWPVYLHWREKRMYHRYGG